MEILITVIWGIAAAGIAYYCLQITKDITYVTLADGRRQERSLPFTFKLLLPFCGNLRQFVMQPKFAAAREKVDAKLVTAGFDGLLSSWEFLAIRILSPIILGTLWTVVIAGYCSRIPSLENSAIQLSLLGFALFAVQPGLWLAKAIKQRQKSIQRAMPFMIDLLTLSVDAGIDFMNALQRSTERRKMDALTEELIRVSHEIQLGAPRRVALRNLSIRVDMPDMRSFTSALIQADELGVSIGTILRIQSEQLRQKRFERAEKLANEAPVKMLGPLMLFIFPAVFIVLLGPILSDVAGNLL